MEEPPVIRSTRECRPSTRYPTSEYVLITDEGEQSWMNTIREEMNSLHKNNTYELVECPKSKKALRNK